MQCQSIDYLCAEASSCCRSLFAFAGQAVTIVPFLENFLLDRIANDLGAPSAS
jgi:hypothetical protein